MATLHPHLRALFILPLLLANPASADDCGCHDSSWNDRDTAAAEGVAVAAAVGVVALTSPLWLDGGHPYVEGGASSVIGRGSFKPSDEALEAAPPPANAIIMGGAGGYLSAGVSRLTKEDVDGLDIRGEVTAWHNQFQLRGNAPVPAPQNFNASVLALGAHVDGHLKGVPAVLSLGGRLGGAYLYSPDADQGALAWDLEAVAGVGVELDKHWMLTGQVRAVTLLPGSNDFTVGNGHAVIADVGLRYNF